MWRALVERWRRWEAARAGRADGRRGIPAAGDPHLPFALRGILARAEDALWREARAWAEEDAQLRERAGEVRAELAEAEARRETLRERIRAARQERKAADAHDDRELERLRAARRELDERAAVGAPATDRAEAEGAADRATGGGGPAASPATDPGSGTLVAPPAIAGGSVAAGAGPDAPAVVPGADRAAAAEPEAFAAGATRSGLRAWVYRLAILLIVAGEFPLNAVAFRLFGEPDLMTAVMVLALAVVLVGMAHGAGLFLAREEPTPRERLLLWGAAGLPVAAIVAVALIRAVYLEEVARRHGLGRWLDAVAFAAINATIFGGAVLLSYLRHDPGSRENLRDAWRRRQREAARAERRERRRRERALRAERRRRERERRERERILEQERRERLRREEEERRLLAGRHREARARLEREARELEARKEARRQELARLEGEAEALEARLPALRERLAALADERLRRWRARRAQALRRRGHFQVLVHAYCAANVRAREDRRTPPSLAEPPAIPLPEEFAADAPPEA